MQTSGDTVYIPSKYSRKVSRTNYVQIDFAGGRGEGRMTEGVAG